MSAIETLISVLCGPDGKCCISGSDDDRRLIDSVLAELAQAAEPVAWLRNTTDPQPHAVTNLKYRSAVDAKAGVEYIPVFAAPQPIQARADGFFLLLPQRPKPEAPAGTAGLDLDAYSGAQMLAFGRDCSDAAIAALRTEQPAPSGATEEVENLRKALVYAAFALHDTPQYMLAQGITLIDGDTVRVSRDGWTVEASVNPHRQTAPATQQAEERVYAFRRKGLADFCTCDEARYEELSNKPRLFETRIFYATPQPTQPQAGAVPLTDEYPALVCDYCGALTPDPWHSSGMLHGKMSKHIHSCDACAARGAAHGSEGGRHGTE